ncbi:MAG: glycosyltransferase family 4 protein [Pyrinomonadaceae bacterium]|nr:glycosyltransferase family 4 protein [Pyrinomonadaceae bacterium]
MGNDTPIKSVHITNYYHKNSGGISTSYNALMAAAGRHKRYMRLIVPGEKEEIEIVNDYAKIYYIPAKKSPVFDKRYRIIMPWQYMPAGTQIRKILIDEKPDMVEITDKYTLSLFGAMVRRGKFKQLNRPMLVHFSCERMDDNIASFLRGGRISEWVARRVMGNYNMPSFDFHIANSPYTAEEFYRSVKKVSNPKRSERFLAWCWRSLRSPLVPIQERIRICPRGVDADQFSPKRKSAVVRREMSEKAGIPEDSVVLLYAGRISPEKNISLLPDFMEILARETEKDYRLLVAGAGPLEDWLKTQTDKRIPGKIIQLGHLDKETLANYYATADIFVHPNPREPFGIAPLEAMASGTPTVVPNAGGLMFYATEENTWLVEPTAEEFSKAIKGIVGDPALRQKKIEKAFEAVENNTRIKSTDFLIETYDELYEDFQKRNELFTDEEASKRFDFAPFFS